MYEPYSSLGFIQVNSGGEAALAGVLDVSGDDAVVDWYVSCATRSIQAQLIATRNALLQADGDIVDIDGSSAVAFGAGPRELLHQRPAPQPPSGSSRCRRSRWTRKPWRWT